MRGGPGVSERPAVVAFDRAWTAVILLAGLAVLAGACKPGARSESMQGRGETGADVAVESGPEARLDSLRALIRAEVAEPSCRATEHCRAIAFGAKPCGGPWAYLVYSTLTADSAGLAALVADYNALEDSLNHAQSRTSDCAYVTPPRLECVSSRCTSGS